MKHGMQIPMIQGGKWGFEVLWFMEGLGAVVQSQRATKEQESPVNTRPIVQNFIVFLMEAMAIA